MDKDMMSYKGLYGSVHFDADDSLFYGKIEFIPASVSYEGKNKKELLRAFEEAVDDYLEIDKTKL